ncbi:hypothetical protein [Candidatus Caldatribacterium sp.]|nr:hypothetical protein [Candidatus Caldatribacterium sp.]
MSDQLMIPGAQFLPTLWYFTVAAALVFLVLSVVGIQTGGGHPPQSFR